jgi:hypothetical protein
MQRVTEKHLQAIVDRINTMTGSPEKPYMTGELSGKMEPQANCYHLSYAYGGVALHRMSRKPGCSGVSSPLSTGHIPKRELQGMLYAFISGLEVSGA